MHRTNSYDHYHLFELFAFIDPLKHSLLVKWTQALFCMYPNILLQAAAFDKTQKDNHRSELGQIGGRIRSVRRVCVVSNEALRLLIVAIHKCRQHDWR